MTTHTIGFSINLTQQDSQTHIAPHLFFQNSALRHLNWVNTIYPKHETNDQVFSSASEQLANYIRYYQNDHRLIIGGDLTALMGVCQGYDNPINLYLFSDNIPSLPFLETPFLLSIQQALPNKSQIFTPKVLAGGTILEINKDKTIDDPQSIICIDIPYLIQREYRILDYLTIQPSTLIITNYDTKCDEDKQTYNKLIQFIQRLTNSP